MGTRGTWGFRKNGHDKTVYRHYDSYPEGLGEEFVQMLRVNNEKKLNELYDNITEIDTTKSPTPEQIQYCLDSGWMNDNVSFRSTDDWYCLLHKLQYPATWYDSIENGKEVFIENYIEFIKDSLFCEYAYIFDLDKKMLEVYEGYQKTYDLHNRYGHEENDDGYYPCKLVIAIPYDYLYDLNNPIDEIIQIMNDAMEGE